MLKCEHSFDKLKNVGSRRRFTAFITGGCINLIIQYAQHVQVKLPNALIPKVIRSDEQNKFS